MCAQFGRIQNTVAEDKPIKQMPDTELGTGHWKSGFTTLERGGTGKQLLHRES